MFAKAQNIFSFFSIFHLFFYFFISFHFLYFLFKMFSSQKYRVFVYLGFNFWFDLSCYVDKIHYYFIIIIYYRINKIVRLSEGPEEGPENLNNIRFRIVNYQFLKDIVYLMNLIKISKVFLIKSCTYWSHY